MSGERGDRGDRGGRLERRYRRLLWAYPRAYREARGDEIVGVLLDAAGPGQARPSWSEVADLVRAGLIARVGAAGAAYRSSPWRDAVAVVSVLLPLLLAVRTVLWVDTGYSVMRIWRIDVDDWAPAFSADLTFGGASAVLWLGAALALVARRVPLAQAGAAGAMVMQVALVVRLAIVDQTWSAGVVAPAVFLVGITATVLLARRPDVERGLDLLGSRSLAWMLVGLVLAEAGSMSWGVLSDQRVGAVARSLGRAGALVVLAGLAWRHRRLLVARALGLRLGVAGVMLVGMSAIVHRVQLTGDGSNAPGDMMTLVALCLAWTAVVVVAAAVMGTAVSRLARRLPDGLRPRR